MPAHSETRILPYTPTQMFDLVLAVEDYPDFLPWCLDSRITRRTKTFLEADVVVGYKIFRETFSSTVRFERPGAIEVDYKKGPLRHLSNRWSFAETRGGCRVGFDVDFSLQSPALNALMSGFFDRALARMIAAFEARARDIYG